MNDNAPLYSDHIGITRHNVDYLLKKYSDFIKIQKEAKVLDIGSGDSTVTSTILLPKLPTDFEKLIGCDISENMVRFAKELHRGQAKLDFVQMDIAAKIPSEFYQYFDNVFSFCCINWVPEDKHQQAFKNMFDLLKPGGQIFLIIIADAPIFDILENVAGSDEWKPFMSDVEQFLSIYRHLDNPEEKLKTFFENAGFVDCLCKVEKLNYTYPSVDFFWNWAVSINPFVNRIPQDKLNKYRDDYLNEVRKHKLMTIEFCEDEETVDMKYTTLVGCALKP